MKASALEFRLRMIIQVIIVFVGFWAPWIGDWNPAHRVSSLGWLALQLNHAGLMSFSAATATVIVLGALFAALGMVLRVWGAAYLGYSTVHHRQMQAGAVMADGPYRYLRNPLYLGGWFMTLAVSLLMPPSGALLCMTLLTVFYLRLILGEEAFLTQELGEPYQNYLRAVPRLLPRPHRSLAAAGNAPHWLTAILTEIMPIGIFFTFSVLAWSYDHMLMLLAFLVSFVASLIARGLMKALIPTCAALLVASVAWAFFHLSPLRTILIGLGVALVVRAFAPRGGLMKLASSAK